MTDLRNPLSEGSPEVTRLSEMMLALLGELAVLTERLDTVERLLEATKVLPRERIENFEPDALATQQRDSRRQTLIANVLKPLRIDAEKSP